MKTPKDAGAAPALTRWSSQEEKDYAAFQKIEKELAELLECDRTDEIIEADIKRKTSDLEEARKRWLTATKMLQSLDNSVPDAKKEGENIPKEECLQMFGVFTATMRLALEQVIIGTIQDLDRCATKEEKYALFAQVSRDTFTSAIRSVAEEEKIPKYVRDAVEAAL